MYIFEVACQAPTSNHSHSCPRGWLDALARGARTVSLSGGPARRHRETVRGLLADACRLALAAWEPVRGLAARRDGWRTEGAGPARRRALHRTADALERAPVGLVLRLRQARVRWLRKRSRARGEKVLGAAYPDAAIIMKGGRAPVPGYHPQIVTGACGMVAAVVVDQGCRATRRA